MKATDGTTSQPRSDPRSGEEIARERLLDHLHDALGAEVLDLLADGNVTELRVNDDGRVWITRLGAGRQLTGLGIDEGAAARVINAVAHSIGLEVGRGNPSFPAELPGSGYRFHGLMPPVVKRPVFVIRKKPQRVFTLDEYVGNGIMSARQAEMLREAVGRRFNILIAGGTDSGKTTLANAILTEMSRTGDRIITVEDTLELICEAEDYVSLRTVPGVRSLRDCLRDVLRMTPDRIVVGEVRGPEVIDMLGGWNTGHPGGLATVHANSAGDALERLEDLVRQGGEVPVPRALAKAIDLIVFIRQETCQIDGVPTRQRRISEMLHVDGVDNGEYRYTPLN
jgi:type IV secretion system protein VirB11